MKKNLLILAVFLTIALSLSFNNQWYLLPPALMVLFIMERRVFRIILKWKFLLFLGILIFGVPLFAGEQNAVFHGFHYSAHMFQMSIVMAGRSVLILLAIKLFTGRISVEQIAEGMQRIHLNHFGQVFALSMQALPEVRIIAGDTYREYRRLPRKKNLFSSLFGFAVRLTVRIIEYAENLTDHHSKKDYADEESCDHTGAHS